MNKIEDLTKPSKPCTLCIYHTKKAEHYCNQYKYNCSIARILEEKECFTVDREEVSNKIISIAVGPIFKIKEGKAEKETPINGLFEEYKKLEFIMAIEQSFNVDLYDHELEKCLTIGDLIDLVAGSL